jgi:hypothetical protein
MHLAVSPDTWNTETPYSYFDATGKPLLKRITALNTNAYIIPAKTLLRVDYMTSGFSWTNSLPVCRIAVR